MSRVDVRAIEASLLSPEGKARFGSQHRRHGHGPLVRRDVTTL